MPDRGDSQQANALNEAKERNESRDGAPRSDSSTTAPGSTQPGAEPARGARDPQRVRGADPLDRWGDLPMHARDVFRSHGGGELPPYYRDWIEQYYRRLNTQR